MHRDASLLRAILDDPDDDDPRLVYADLLEERGDPRAEFIRAQCELAALPPGDDRGPDLEATALRLLRRHGKGWAGPVRRWVKGWTFRRGFVEGVKLRADAFLARAADLLDAAPIRHVQLLGAAEHIDSLAACPYLARLNSLGLQDNFVLGAPPDARRSPGDWRQWWRVRTPAREAAQAAGAGHLRRLLASPHLAGLRALNLENNRLGRAGIRALTESPRLETMTSLDLRRNDMGAEEVRHLADSPIFARLTAIRLGHCRSINVLSHGNTYDGGRERGPERGSIVSPLAPRLGRLTSLDLGACYVDERAVVLLAGGRAPGPLKALHLERNPLEFAGIQALVRSPLLDRLTTLNLSSCYLEADAVRVLAACPKLAGLTALALRNNRLGPDGVRALLESPHLDRLARLELAASFGQWYARPIGDEGVRALAHSSRLPRLSALDLRKNGIGPEGIRALADSPLLEQFTWLDLRGNSLGNAGAAILASRGPWARLAWLDLRECGIGKPARHALRAAFGPQVRFGTEGTRRPSEFQEDDIPF